MMQRRQERVELDLWRKLELRKRDPNCLVDHMLSNDGPAASESVTAVVDVATLRELADREAAADAPHAQLISEAVRGAPRRELLLQSKRHLIVERAGDEGLMDPCNLISSAHLYDAGIERVTQDAGDVVHRNWLARP